MTADQLKELLGDLIALLTALKGKIPNWVDDELVAFLQQAEQSPILLELLVKTLPPAQQVRRM